MSQVDPASGTQPRGAPEFGRADDKVIGKAFRISLVIFVALGAILALVVYLSRPRRVEKKVEDARPVAAQRQERSATPPAVRFTDVTEEAGIAFVHQNGARGQKLLPETMGPGCAFFDFDNDEDPDLLIQNGKPWASDADGGTAAAPTPVLYRNDGSGRFTDVTAGSGVDVPIYGMGIAVGDYDADGWRDIYLTGVGGNRLLRNKGGGRFEDATQAAGVAGGGDWSTGAGFFDADADGDLDLFVCNYVRWSREIDLAVDYRLVGVGRAYGPPTNFAGTQPYFFRNNGDGTFRECAREAGFHVVQPTNGLPMGKGLGLLPMDFDRDQAIDVMVANDTVSNFLFHNRGDGTFEEVGQAAGIAFDGNGAATGAMGIDCAYYRGDLTLAVGVGNFANEPTSLYVSEEGRLLFSDQSFVEGVGAVSRQMLKFGIFFLDYDLDGRLDLFQTNGHLEEEINKVQPSQHYEQPSQLFWNCGPEFAAAFVPVDGATTGDLAKPVVGRASACADIDLDGDLDILVTQCGRRPLLLRNEQASGHGWLRLRLQSRGANADAIGAWVEVSVQGKTQRQHVMPTRSYLSQIEPVLTFGLGSAPRADAVRIGWPGASEVHEIGELPARTRKVIVRPSP